MFSSKMSSSHWSVSVKGADAKIKSFTVFLNVGGGKKILSTKVLQLFLVFGTDLQQTLMCMYIWSNYMGIKKTKTDTKSCSEKVQIMLKGEEPELICARASQVA